MKISKPVVFLGLASLFTDAASEMIYPLLPLFLSKELGASAAVIGLIEGVADSTSAVSKFLFGWWSDKLRKRTRFVAAGYLLANLVRPLIGLALQPWHVLTLRFTDRVGKGMRTAPRDAWLASLAGEHKRGLVFGFHRGMDHAGAVIGPLVATLFLAFYPGELRPLFLISIVPGLAAVGFILAAKRASTEPAQWDARTETPHFSAAVPPAFKHYLLILSVFVLGSSSDVFLLMKLQEAGLDIKFIPLAWSALHVVKSLMSVPGGWWADRVGARPSILMGWVVFAVSYTTLAMSDRLTIVIGAFLLYGFFPALTESAEKAYISKLVPDHARGTAFGLHNLVTGLGAFPASLVFGYLWTAHGPQTAFLTGAALAASAVILLLFLKPASTNHFDGTMGSRSDGR